MSIVYDPTDTLEDAIYKVFFTFISEVNADETVYMLEDNFNAPSGQYIALRLSDVEPVSVKTGWDTAVDPDTAEQITYNNFIGYVNLFVYGAQALSRAQQIAFGLRNKNTKKVLQDNGLGITASTMVRNASRAIDETKIEQRAQMSVSFNFVQKTTTVNSDGFIEHINTEGTLDDHTEDDLVITPSASSPDAT
jgi:hypothetical protein